MEGATEGDHRGDAAGFVGCEGRGQGRLVGLGVGLLGFAVQKQVCLIVEAGQAWGRRLGTTASSPAATARSSSPGAWSSGTGSPRAA